LCYKHLADALVRNQTQEGRLFELYGKPLPQRVVKHTVARSVRKIGENNCVFVRESVFLAGVQQPAAYDQCHRQYRCACDLQPSKVAGLCEGLRLSLCSRDGRRGWLCIAPQPLQIRPNFGSGLVAQFPVFL
jgi:hypothetical protein